MLRTLSGSLPTEDDWAGPGSKATTYMARVVADSVRAIPLDCGGLQIELHINGIDLEIEVTENGKIKSVFWEAV